MADVVWPASLPQEALLAGEQQDLGEQVIRTPMEVGPDKLRMRTSAGVDTFPIGLWLDATQYLAFLTFFRSSLNGGALAFLWKNPLTGNPADLRIVGQPRIVPGASRSSTQRQYRVTFQVELMPGTEVTGGAPPAAPESRAGGGAGVGGGGEDDAAGFEASEWTGNELEAPVLGFLPFEADVAPPDLIIELISGFGSGFAGDEGQGVPCDCDALSESPVTAGADSGSISFVNGVIEGGGLGIS